MSPPLKEQGFVLNAFVPYHNIALFYLHQLTFVQIRFISKADD